LELSQSVVRGTISSTRRTLRDFPVYQSDLRAAPGSSGGPVFDQHGNLVALIIGKFEQEDWITILNPINNAYPLLARFGIYVPPRTDPSTEELMPANGLTLRQAKAIEAYNLGVRSNDVMTKRDAYRKATDLLPEFFEAWFNLGVVLTRLGDYAGACNAYERALTLQPSSPQALRNYGRLKLLLRDYEAASAAFEKVLDLRPDDPQTYNDCGEAYRRQGKIQRAIEYFEKATTLNPKYAPAYYNLGACFVELQRYTEAVRALENYLRVAEDADDKVQVRRWIEDLQGKTKASP
jgi:tetratricopeptide (TPR) repeat protein